MKKLMRSKCSLIRPICVRKHFWSDPIAFEEVVIRPNCVRRGYDQIKMRPKSSLIRPKCARNRLWSDFSDQVDLWSDHRQTIVQTVMRSNFLPDAVISVWEHTGVRSTGSDHKPIWVWTSTWVEFALKAIVFNAIQQILSWWILANLISDSISSLISNLISKI